MSDMERPVRKAFHDDLDHIDRQVSRLFAMVTESLAAATDTFLAGDRETALEVKSRDAVIDELERDVEAIVERVLLFQAPVASEFHHLIAVLRIVPELERSGDLAEHIASRAAKGLGTKLPASVRGIIERMGEKVVAMWRTAADAFADRDGTVEAQLRADDDEVNAMHTELCAALVAADPPTEVAMEMALVARFYERLGDHAEHITARLPRR
jgi:phosphate transport system protein